MAVKHKDHGWQKKGERLEQLWAAKRWGRRPDIFSLNGLWAEGNTKKWVG